MPTLPSTAQLPTPLNPGAAGALSSVAQQSLSPAGATYPNIEAIMAANPNLTRFSDFMMTQENAPLLERYKSGKVLPTDRFPSYASLEKGLNTAGYGRKFETQKQQDAYDAQGGQFYSQVASDFGEDLVKN